MGDMADSTSHNATERAIHSLIMENDIGKMNYTAATKCLSILKPFIEHISTYDTLKESYFGIAMRCVAVRSFEAMSSIIELVDKNRAYNGIALLRPMCEDYIFTKFLQTLNESDASDYIWYRAKYEIAEGELAQEKFFYEEKNRFLDRKEEAPSDVVARSIV